MDLNNNNMIDINIDNKSYSRICDR